MLARGAVEHRLRFTAWGVLMIVHILAYLTHVLRERPADWRRNAKQIVAGPRSRRALLGGALVAGVIVALGTYPAQRTWLNHRHEHRHPVGRAVGVAHSHRPAAAPGRLEAVTRGGSSSGTPPGG